MISEITVHPKPQNNYAKIFSLVSVALAVVCIIIYSIVEIYRGVIGVGAVMFIVTAVLLYTKYVAVDFYYDITFDSQNVPLFIVRQITGKRQTTLCRIELWDIDSIMHRTSNEHREQKRKSGVLRYVYAPTLFPKETYVLAVCGKYEKCEIVIECSHEFAEMLRTASLESRDLRPADEEE